MSGIEAPPLASETIAHIGSFEVRNTLIMAWLAMAVVFIVVFFARRTKFKQIPGRFQALLELIVEGLFNFFNSIIGDTKQTRRFFPLIATIFLFLMLANWMGILPGVGSITILGEHDGHMLNLPIFRSMNADVNMTLAVALISVIATQLFGIAALGVMPYANKFFVAPWRDPIGSFVGILELIAEMAKIISFTFRLFGNIFAGEVLLVVIGFLMPYVAPIPFLGLELFVGFVQALVFSMLTAVFLKMAVTAHGGHEEHGHEGGHAVEMAHA
ncbi:MAG TPA: ATP synthase F0 subunit A [Candidatus Peribacter riflensis]|uniref:ATP synthase subunit a n=1 Tax=Candidatus Peribacter riflensis TaxID=1735162 RepID=A0A0S1SLF8_9BACT|nr:MAG: F-type H +-transporting ATPase subunit a [Candidatus Peribacter riflensis]OGJ78109.1 MAG: ATP synthase F0 subunit A [Candidatus Peribacteria bacterium RIFOXYC1_FULL_58_8]OGJ79355.1 MAG: ATP synthase F0 subunit A [Candidatus Peribacteria bacterium RIFOXYB1_FULL_57_12]ALM10672.1 MAG: F-type H+-transporting ATPase subunit a [Candidatus Peribacter riflensis]ALM11774.1 MAG: F-type H +-transporting ATPase subunit a [Candidatus Peribacter riflensis]